MVFDGYLGMYRNTCRGVSDDTQRVFMKDAPLGSLIGQDIHQFTNPPTAATAEGVDMTNQYTAETSEKTKLIRLDTKGFNMYVKGFLETKYSKLINFLQTVGLFKRTRSQFCPFMNLIQMFNSRKVFANTVIV